MQHPDNRPTRMDTDAALIDRGHLERIRAEIAALPPVDEHRLCMDRLHRTSVVVFASAPSARIVDVADPD